MIKLPYTIRNNTCRQLPFNIYIFFLYRDRTSQMKLGPLPQHTPDTEIRSSEEMEDPNNRAADCKINNRLFEK